MSAGSKALHVLQLLKQNLADGNRDLTLLVEICVDILKTCDAQIKSEGVPLNVRNAHERLLAHLDEFCNELQESLKVEKFHVFMQKTHEGRKNVENWVSSLHLLTIYYWQELEREHDKKRKKVVIIGTREKLTVAKNCQIADPQGSRMWAESFGLAITVVRWEEFIASFEKHMGITIKTDLVRALHHILDSNDTGFVSAEAFSAFLDCYGSPSSCLQRVSSFMAEKFFFDVSQEEALKLLQGQPVGTFLVRFAADTGCLNLIYVSKSIDNPIVTTRTSTARPLITFVQTITDRWKLWISPSTLKIENFPKEYSSLTDIVSTFPDLLKFPYSATFAKEPYFIGELTLGTDRSLLADQPPGTFYVRFSQTPGYYVLCYKTATSDFNRALISSHPEFHFVETNGDEMGQFMDHFLTMSELIESVSWLKYPFEQAKRTARDDALNSKRTQILDELLEVQQKYVQSLQQLTELSKEICTLPLENTDAWNQMKKIFSNLFREHKSFALECKKEWTKTALPSTFRKSTEDYYLGSQENVEKKFSPRGITKDVKSSLGTQLQKLVASVKSDYTFYLSNYRTTVKYLEDALQNKNFVEVVEKWIQQQHFVKSDLFTRLQKIFSAPIKDFCRIMMLTLDLKDIFPVSVQQLNEFVQGAEAIREMFKQALAFRSSSPPEPWHEYKLIVVGKEDVGRTSLVSSLTKGKANKAEHSATGIQMAYWKPSVDLPIGFNCCDFGGQDLAYSTYEFFLSTKAFYVLTFKLTQVGDTGLNYWLKQIRRHQVLGVNAKPIVFIVGTHADEFAKLPAEEQEQCLSSVNRLIAANTRFLNIVTAQVFQVCCIDGKGIKELKDKLLIEAEKCLFYAQTPQSFLQLAQLIEEAKSRLSQTNGPLDLLELDWDNFRTWGRICNVSPNKVVEVASFLHDVGRIVFYHDPRSGMNNLVILNPAALAAVVSDIVGLNHVCANGLAPMRDIISALKRYGPDTQRKLLQILCHFEVIHHYPKLDLVFIPALLPSDPSLELKSAWLESPTNQQYEIGRLYRPNFLPSGFFSKLMIRLMCHLPERIPSMWSNGLYISCGFGFGREEALVIYDPADFSLLVRVRGHRTPLPPETKPLSLWGRTQQAPYKIYGQKPPHSLFLKIIQVTDALFETQYSREVQETHGLIKEIPCLECAQQARLDAHMFKYEEVLRLMTAGRSTIDCPLYYCHRSGGKQKIPLIDLAPDLAFVDVIKIPPESLVIESEIGKGGFGIVYKGKLKLAHKMVEVAIKRLNFISEETRTRTFEEFGREIKIMSSLQHSNLVQLFGMTMKPPQMVMEYCPLRDIQTSFHIHDEESLNLRKERQDLQDQMEQSGHLLAPSGGSFLVSDIHKKIQQVEEKLIKKQRELDQNIPWKLRVAVSLDVAQAMKYLHGLEPPIIHRDLRSPNVFLVSMDLNDPIHAKLADFGLSTYATGQISQLLSTWQWLAPEIIDVTCSKYDQTADIYSFGILCWEIATALSEVPYSEFQPKSPLKIRQEIVTQDLRPTIPNYVPPSYAQLIRRCWTFQPSERPSFSEICSILSNLMDTLQASE